MYFFDVTDIVLYVESETSISGIQRVSFEVIKRMIERHGLQAVRLSYWDRKRREYLSIEASFVAEMVEFDPDVWNALFYGRRARPQRHPAPTLERYRNRPFKYYLRALRRSYEALRGNEAHFTKRGSSLSEWKRFRTSRDSRPTLRPQTMTRTPISHVANAGDKLIVLGATWAIDGITENFQSLKDQHRLEISQLVHDLIPIITPEHIAGNFSQEFYDWLSSSLGYCANYIANSENTAKDLNEFMREVDVVRPITTIPLAQQFTNFTSINKINSSSPMTGVPITYRDRVAQTLNIRRDILNLIKVPFVLVVGTMESRKNIWRLLQVWKRLSLIEGINLPKLVFAGKPGWYNDDFNQFMSATGNLNGWAQLALRPTDVELAFLYSHCEFTAMVSFYEGWGLPIGEGLSFGKTAVVAKNSSMPEVGGDLVEYCDAHSIDSIQAACLRLISDLDHRTKLEDKISVTKLRSWDDVASDFVTALS